MFLDMGVGMLLGIWLPPYFGVDTSWWWVVVGCVAVLLPDVDIGAEGIPHTHWLKRYVGEHRGVLHRPLLWAVISFCVWMSGAPLYASLLFFGTFFHLVHDTFFLGWGIMWMWPWRQTKWSFFRDAHGRITSDCVRWEPHEEVTMRHRYGTRHWVRDFYLRPSIVSVLEYSVFLYAVWCVYVTLF